MVRSIDRGFDVLGLLAESEQPLTLAEITARLDLPRTTAFSIVRTLARRGAVQAIEGRGYRVGPLIAELAQAHRPTKDLVELARPYLETLVRQTGETVFLAVPSGDEVVFVDKIESPQAIRFSAQIGTRRPLYCSAHGKVALAAHADAAIAQYLARTPLVAHTDRTHTDPAGIAKEVGKIRRLGYAASDAEFTPGVYSLAAPIGAGADGLPLGIVSAAGPAERVKKRRQEIAGLLLDCARQAAQECRQHGLGLAPASHDS